MTTKTIENIIKIIHVHSEKHEKEINILRNQVSELKNEVNELKELIKEKELNSDILKLSMKPLKLV